MKVLSLFDGISVAQQALKELGVEVEYFSSEIDKYAISTTRKNFPNTHHIGGVQTVTKFNFPHLFDGSVDLVIGGSPCQDLSIAKANRKGLDGDRSGLFWEFARIVKEAKPKYFVLENVASMPREARDIITKTMGVEPVLIDAALVSAQHRKRLFWSNIPNIKQPEDRGIFLKDILETGDVPFTKYGIEKMKSNTVRSSGRSSGVDDKHNWDTIRLGHIGREGGAKTGPYLVQTARGKNAEGAKALDGKTPVLTSSSWEHNNKLTDGTFVRKLTPVECERLQSLPDGYTDGQSNSQRYKMLGNAFNKEVVKHILSHI